MSVVETVGNQRWRLPSPTRVPSLHYFSVPECGAQKLLFDHRPTLTIHLKGRSRSLRINAKRPSIDR